MIYSRRAGKNSNKSGWVKGLPKETQDEDVAEADLVEVWLQVADDGGNDRADEYISRVQAICELIASQPDMGVGRPDIAEGVRSFPVDRYVIYYGHDGSTLSVLRIWHTARDPESLSTEVIMN